jgi:diguanylate cyclase (GGDEF)-like protein
MLARWNLPETFRLAAAGSHDPESLGTSKHDRLVRSVTVASHIAEIWTSPKTGAVTATARHASIALLQIPTDRFERHLGEIAAELPEATSNLDIDLGGEQAVNRLLDEAREALVVLNLQAQQEARDFQHRSQIDRLTSLYNRAYLDEILPQYFDASRRQAAPLSVIFLDLDHFKTVNDTYGHEAGDRVLVAVAKILRSAVRAPDIVVRYGGEEFVALLPNTTEQGAEFVGQRLRAAIASQRYDISEGRQVSTTISVGCATASLRRPFSNERELINAADKCLYAAKGAGRNKVVSHHSLSSTEIASLG